MTSLTLVSYQYRSFDHLFIFKPQHDQLILKVYDLGQKCIYKRTIFLDELLHASPSDKNNNAQNALAAKLPEEIQNASMLLEACHSDLAFLLKLIDLKDFRQEQNYTAPSVESCEEEIYQAVQQYKPKVSVDCKELEGLECPIIHEVFKEPVMDECGHTFEKSAIEQHLNSPNAVCPISRQPINILTPNLHLKSLIEKYQKREPIPCFSLFRKENFELANQHLEIAQKYIEQKEYGEALESFSKAFQYTKDWHHYMGLPDLFIKLKEPEKALLASLYLALYQIRDHKIPEAINTVEGCQQFHPLAIVLIQLYQLNNEHPKALQFVNKSAQALCDSFQPKKVIALYKQILAGDPDQFDLYESLAKLLESPKEKAHILLKGACHALESNNLVMAEQLLKAIESNNSFLDQLVSLNLIKMRHPPSVLRKKIRSFAEECNRTKQLEQALKAYKLLSNLEPTFEVFQAIDALYHNLGKPGKVDKWRITQMCHLIRELQDTKAQLHEARLQLGLDKEVRIIGRSQRSGIQEIAFGKADRNFLKTQYEEKPVLFDPTFDDSGRKKKSRPKYRNSLRKW